MRSRGYDLSSVSRMRWNWFRRIWVSIMTTVSLAIFTFSACAAPSGGEVNIGTGTISQNGKTVTIMQTTNKLGINWQNFNIASDEKVIFVQPGLSSIALNRIVGSQASTIAGQLIANGKVFLINPNGILFSPTAEVNVGGLVASSLAITDSNFSAGKYIFNGSGGSVINQGNITAAEGNYVVLLGGEVQNQGIITAESGTAALGAGGTITLDIAGDGLINLAVSAAVSGASAVNSNLIQANGGRVLMTARSADALAGTVVNNSGTLKADSISTVNGIIRLDGGANGAVSNSGTLSAAGSSGEKGGNITLTGGAVNIGSASSISAAGAQGGTLKISSAGDIALNSSLSAGNNASVILRADSNGTGNGTVVFNGSGGVALSGSGTAEIYYNASDYTTPADYSARVTGGVLTAYMLVNNVNQLQNINNNLAGAYALGKDIDASATSSWNSGAGFMPLGINSSGRFAGIFNGDGHIVNGLYINRPSQPYLGLFGFFGGVVKNVGLTNVSISGVNYTGGLVGFNAGSIISSYSSGQVNGSHYAGGLVGDNYIGSNISNCYTSGIVSGIYHVGGLVGGNTYGSISGSYSSSTVTGGANSQYVGGLVGHNGNDSGTGSDISNCYSTGAVSGTDKVGGLVGENSGTINNSYSAGAVSGSTSVGGLAGANNGSFSGSYWNMTTSGMTDSAGGNGLTSTQMRDQTNFAGWDFTNLWRIYNGYTYPLLKSFLTPLTVTANDYIRTYDGTAGYAGNAGVSYSLSSGGSLLGTVVYGGTAASANNAGSYMIVPSGLYSNQQGYDISYSTGMLQITPRPITVTANASRVYGNANPASGAASVIAGGLAGTDTLSSANLSTTASVTSNVGNYSLTPSGVTFTKGSAANYTITYADGTLTITPRPITVTASNDSRVYGDANPSTGIVSVTKGNLVGTDAIGGTADLSSEAVDTSSVGNYSLTPSGVTFTKGSAANYTITYADGALMITPRPISVTANASRAYGDANPATGTASLAAGGLVGTDSLGKANLSSEAAAASNTGDYSLTPSGVTFSKGSAANYTITYVDGTLTITPRPITVKANNVSRVYGDANPSSGIISLTKGNLVGTDAIGGTADLSSEAVVTSSVGNYSLTPSGVIFTNGNAANYTITYADGTMTITPRALTVTANNASRAYGDANPSTGTVNVTDGVLVGADSLGKVNLSSEATVTSSVGNYSLTPSGVTFTKGSAANYAITYADGMLTITPRAISVTANASRVYGNANPATGIASVAAGGLVGTDSLGNVNLLSTASVASNVGNYSLTPSGVIFTKGSAANYSITYVDGTLSITPRAISVTANNASRVFGDVNPSSGTVSVTNGSLAGTDAISSTANVTSPAVVTSKVGNYSLTPSGVTFTTGNAANYTITYVNGALTITPRPITVTANNASRVYGDGNPSTGAVSVIAGGLVGTDALGEANLLSAASAGSSVGNYSLTPSGVKFISGSADNYVITYADGVLTITPRPLAVEAAGKNKLYDGTTSASVTFKDNRLDGDTFAVNGNAAFSDPNPGDNKTVNVTNISISGVDAGNYSLQNTFAFTTANIVTRESALDKARTYLQPLFQPLMALSAVKVSFMDTPNSDYYDWLLKNHL